jgi:hypothetical protein
MANDLNSDMKDNDGGFNCGKPAGYIEDFKALPEKTQELIRQIKRVRVMFGTVELHDVTDAQGNPVDLSHRHSSGRLRTVMHLKLQVHVH